MELYASAFDLVMVCLGHVVVWTKYMSIYGAYKRMKANTHCYHLPHRKDRGRESNYIERQLRLSLIISATSLPTSGTPDIWYMIMWYINNPAVA